MYMHLMCYSVVEFKSHDVPILIYTLVGNSSIQKKSEF